MENQNQIDPPEDLAGYQHVLYGKVEKGDILVGGKDRQKAWAVYFVGTRIEDMDSDIYRKMPCPKAGDHDKAWKNAHDEEKLKSMAWVGERPKAKTSDEGKPPLAMLPWGGLRRVAMVQAGGHNKYKDYHNYRKGMEVSRNLSCAMRHLADYMDGLDLDKESGECNLAHAATRILFAIQNLVDGTAIDDRYKSK